METIALPGIHTPNQLYIENLYRRFPDPKTGLPQTVLENVDLRVNPGEFVSIIGPSGCGKSTLLRICLGADLGYEGNVIINGKPVQFPDSTRGLVPQKYGVYPHLTVLKNVLIGLELKYPIWYRMTHKKELRAQAMEYLNDVQLAEHADKYPYQLSGGQQQRVSIAQTLVTGPGMVFMDEPFGALDQSTRERVQVFMLQLWEKHKMTVFFVTHDIGEAVYLGTRLILLSQYYVDDRGDVDEKGNPLRRGAKIITDIPLTGTALPTKVKGEKSFIEIVRSIAEGPGFKPDHREHVRDFNLAHSNSFQTLTALEDKTGNGNGRLKKMEEQMIRGG
ncbi:MAG: ABC transporter ATP-binding protein [Candidatus Pacebacteria bacterium]|nr:ABC transporter ATP-binding protein [Candidatus Paceibacterota bacterium]